MPNSLKEFKFDYYIELILRYRWYLLVPFCISMIIGIFLVFYLPRIYNAETLILVEPQKVSSSYVQSLVASDIDSRISTISQQIMSRTNIEKIISEFRLYDKPENENMYMEDKIDNVRKQISVKVTNAREGADAFSISFQGEEPRKVTNVANALATYFIDENLKVREAQAIGTSDFLENERGVMLKRLEEVEKALKDYRTEHMGELPEQLNSNLSLLDRLQTEMSEKQKRLTDAKIRLIELETLLKDPSSSIPRPNSMSQSNFPDNTDPNYNLSLEQLEKQLSGLLTNYTANHPDVMKLKHLIAKKKADLNAKQNDEYSKELEGTTKIEYLDESSRKQLADIRKEIRLLEQDITQLHKQINVYQYRIESTPKREQELMSLNRDYANILASYNSLLNRKLEAEIAVNMEKKQKGEQFRIIDLAKLPEKPISPNPKKLFIIVLFSGLGIGCGLTFLRDYLDTSFRSKDDITSFLNIPILASIPLIVQPQVQKRQNVHNILSIFSIMMSISLFASFAAINFIGADKTIELFAKII